MTVASVCCRETLTRKTQNEISAEEKSLSLFHPGGLAEEYFESLRKREHLEGEKALLLAVLEDAIACLQKYSSARDPRGRQLFHEAEHWIMEGKDGSLFSFDSVCELLGLDPHYLRQGLRRWKKKQNRNDRLTAAAFIGKPRDRIADFPLLRNSENFLVFLSVA